MDNFMINAWNLLRKDVDKSSRGSLEHSNTPFSIKKSKLPVVLSELTV